jgi:hypothetical protein
MSNKRAKKIIKLRVLYLILLKSECFNFLFVDFFWSEFHGSLVFYFKVSCGEYFVCGDVLDVYNAIVIESMS